MKSEFESVIYSFRENSFIVLFPAGTGKQQDDSPKNPGYLILSSFGIAFCISPVSGLKPER